MSQEVSSDSQTDVDEILDGDDYPLLLLPLLKMRNSFLWFAVGMGIIIFVAGIVSNIIYGDLPISGLAGVLGVSIALFGFIGQGIVHWMKR